MITIRKATASDLDAIETIYNNVHTAEEAGKLTIGWDRNVYPVRATAAAALDRDDLFVMLDNDKVVATALINQIQVPEYANCNWRYDALENEVMVLHTLAVDPDLHSNGYGREFVKFYESFAIENNCHYLRMDTNEKNAVARRFYAKMGYEERGVVPCVFNGIPGVGLVCLEKKV